MGLLFIGSSLAFAQAKSGVENYNLLSSDQAYSWMPILHYQSDGGFYSELRYNYEDIKTVSIYGGKKFSAGKQGMVEFIPMLGVSAGTFTGVSMACNTEGEWDHFFISVQTQYSMSTKKERSDFFFNWSEVAIKLSQNVFAGAAAQITLQRDLKDFQPGFMAGFSLGKISIPLYMFNPFQPDRWLLMGINYEYLIKKRMNKSKNLP